MEAFDMKIGLNDIKVEWLNTKALVLISIFASEANKLENIIIDLRRDDVLKQVSSVANSSEELKLKELYAHIKKEVKMSLYTASKNKRFGHDVTQLSNSSIAERKPDSQLT